MQFLWQDVFSMLIWNREGTTLMKFYRYLYLDPQIKHPILLKQKLRMNKTLPGVYLIRMSENPSDQLEIIQAIYLKQKWMREEKNEIVGIALSKSAAVELVTSIVEDVVNETGGADIKTYLVRKSRE